MPRYTRRPSQRSAPARALSGARGIGGVGSASSQVFLVRLWKETRKNVHLCPVWRGEVSDLRRRRLGTFSIVGRLANLLADSPELVAILQRDSAGEAPRADTV